MNIKISHGFSLMAIPLLVACASPSLDSGAKPEYGSMGCAAPPEAKIVSTPDTRPASLAQDYSPVDSSVGASKEARLEELKRLFYLKYLSKEAYTEMKKGILDSP